MSRVACFNRFGQSTAISIDLYQDIEFAFVPGATVTLSWEALASTVAMMSKDSEKGFLENLVAQVRRDMSLAREVIGSTMPVEWRPKDLGWTEFRKLQDMIQSSASCCSVIHSGNTITYTAVGRGRHSLLRSVRRDGIRLVAETDDRG
jgi:hypothetical protein